MRSEREMYDLILKTAIDDERIHAVILQGSRANPNAKKDIFQDYDIIYVVDSTEPFINDKKWIDRFGERLLMQYPEDSVFYENDVANCYGWLIQFTDGNRIDLHVCTLSCTLEELKDDNLFKVLLDKKKCITEIPKATDSDRWVKKPDEKEFRDACNEFWWCLLNVAKGLWRDEIPYAMDMINYCLRPMLVKLLSWKIGCITDFSVSIGKSGKYMRNWLDECDWKCFLKTYPSGKVESVWGSVFVMCSLFNRTAIETSKLLSFSYNKEEAINCLRYLKSVQNLPKDASEITIL